MLSADQTTGKQRICAEAPPDVGEAVASQVGAQLAAKGVDAGTRAATAATILQLAPRSQGLELIRAMPPIYCYMWLTGVLGEDEYRARVDNAFAAGVSLISQEINKGLPSMQSKAEAPTIPTPTPTPTPTPSPTPTPTPTPKPTPG
ncbi:hypothetical protein [Sphingomonas lenta]|uniref:hypothetical protein n=1 Tax=Sphingomonas lenta TaxID=1141887 RepID=UPI00159545D2|nr:hypothetical protein [Sphingomonas lenta]